LAENDLLQSPDPVLGVIWDGTGLGLDGHIWGGEFFLRENGRMERVAHLDNFDFLLGDKMPREPRISALSLCKGMAEVEAILRSKFAPNEWSLYRRLLEKGSSLLTSSMGRLFDGVACLLGLGDVQTFEGEAAMRLEQMATGFFKNNGLRSVEGWLESLDNQGNMPFSPIIKGLVDGLKKGDEIPFLAARFHASLVHGIRLVAQRFNAKKLAFSGGAWQNGLLVDLAIEHLSGEYGLFFHRQISPNDECVSFGQLTHHSSFNI
jgi:hydrogenase maturation protein HypF